MTMKTILAAVTAVLCLLLSGCAGEETPAAETPAAAPVSTPIATAAPAESAASAAGAVPAESAEIAAETSEVPVRADDASAYTPASGVFTYQDGETVWTLTLRENGPYTLQKTGDVPHTGESWTANGDGSIGCGPTDLWTEAFADSNGCSSWILYADGRCEPIFPG